MTAPRRTPRRTQPAAPVGGPDPRAKKILLDLYWNSRGWTDRDARALSPDDRAWAAAHGMLFPRHTTTHDALVADLIRACAAVELTTAAGHFLASLSTGRLDLRCGIASRALADGIVEHPYAGDGAVCARCGAYRTCEDEDLDVLQFERHKWGGVRHPQVLFQWFDLARLAEEPPPCPTDADRAILGEILRVIASAAPDERPSRLAARLADVLGANKAAREACLEVLAAAGILRASDPRRGCGDFFELAGAWRGEDGFDRDRVAALFGPHGFALPQGA